MENYVNLRTHARMHNVLTSLFDLKAGIGAHVHGSGVHEHAPSLEGISDSGSTSHVITDRITALHRKKEALQHRIETAKAKTIVEPK